MQVNAKPIQAKRGFVVVYGKSNTGRHNQQFILLTLNWRGQYGVS
jgi:hypothetical protein